MSNEANLRVKLINYTKDGERTIAQAGKLCYSKVGVDEIEENLTPDQIKKYLNLLINIGHLSPIEHISFTFAAEGVSRSLTHQLVRHRLASYSQQSQRYVGLERFLYIIPKDIKEDKDLKEIFIKQMESSQKAYNDLVEKLSQKNYERLIAEGYDSKKALKDSRKKAYEDSRYVFPNACESKIVFTMNARSLIHFFKLRSCNRAQWEIRELSDKMLEQVKNIYPNLFENAGPSCINGPCPEGAMTCGKINEVREKYKNN